MLTAFIQAAMRHAVLEWVAEDHVYWGELTCLPDVWATGPSEAECLAELQSVLEGWIILGLRLGHAIPAVDGIELVPTAAAA